MKSIFIFTTLGIISIALFFFTRKNRIEYEFLYQVPDGNKEFYPNAYVFFHSKRQLEDFTKLNEETKIIGQKIISISFDFNKYSYCIFFGKKITNMYHSGKTSFFDDPTPSYARTKGKIPVFVEYENDSNNTGIFIYRMPRDIRLRGFYD